jgi:hypothetical protein
MNINITIAMTVAITVIVTIIMNITITIAEIFAICIVISPPHRIPRDVVLSPM